MNVPTLPKKRGPKPAVVVLKPSVWIVDHNIKVRFE